MTNFIIQVLGEPTGTGPAVISEKPVAADTEIAALAMARREAENDSAAHGHRVLDASTRCELRAGKLEPNYNA